MIDRKKLAIHLYKNFGAISFIIGLTFLIFGLMNLGILPHFYESQSGSAGLDGMATLLVNALLWVGFCSIMLALGYTFYFCGRDIEKMELKEKGLDTIHFFLLAVPFALGLEIYLVLLLMGIISPIQFFPNKLFVGEVLRLDLSLIFNAFLLFFGLSIFHRISERFIKYGIKLGEIE